MIDTADIADGADGVDGVVGAEGGMGCIRTSTGTGRDEAVRADIVVCGCCWRSVSFTRTPIDAGGLGAGVDGVDMVVIGVTGVSVVSVDGVGGRCLVTGSIYASAIEGAAGGGDIGVKIVGAGAVNAVNVVGVVGAAGWRTGGIADSVYASFDAGAADFVYASYATSFRSMSENAAADDGSLIDAGRSFACASSAAGGRLADCVLANGGADSSLTCVASISGNGIFAYCVSESRCRYDSSSGLSQKLCPSEYSIQYPRSKAHYPKKATR